MLKTQTVKSAKATGKTYYLNDGDNLRLKVDPKGRKYWDVRYRLNGKRVDHRIGAYPRYSLVEARQERTKLLEKVDEGVSPNDVVETFRSVAERWYVARSAEWSAKYRKATEGRLRLHVYDAIGDLPIDTITTKMVTQLLSKFHGADKKSAKLEARDKTHQQITSIFSLAQTEDLITKNPAEFDKKNAQLQRRVGELAPEPQKSLKWDLLPKFWEDLSSYSTEAGEGPTKMTQLLIKLQILTLVRPGEIRCAVWSEFDFDKRLWTIPKEKMKMRKPHLVPLSNQVITLLRELQEITGHCDHLFPLFMKKGGGFDDTGTMSDNTARMAIKRLGYDCVPHGFRHMGSGFLHSLEIGEEGEERAMFDSLWVEYQLSHNDPNKVRRTYNEYDYLKARTRMMQFYSDQIIPQPSLRIVQSG